MAKKRDLNILKSKRREVKMNTSVVPPKRGKGSKYNRAKQKRAKWL